MITKRRRQPVLRIDNVPLASAAYCVAILVVMFVVYAFAL